MQRGSSWASQYSKGLLLTWFMEDWQVLGKFSQLQLWNCRLLSNWIAPRSIPQPIQSSPWQPRHCRHIPGSHWDGVGTTWTDGFMHCETIKEPGDELLVPHIHLRKLKNLLPWKLRKMISKRNWRLVQQRHPNIKSYSGRSYGCTWSAWRLQSINLRVQLQISEHDFQKKIPVKDMLVPKTNKNVMIFHDLCDRGNENSTSKSTNRTRSRRAELLTLLQRRASTKI